jgi:acetate kinase
VRKKCCENLEFLGIGIDDEKNEKAKRVEAEIQAKGSKVKVLCIPTNEELVIALDTRRVIQEAKERKQMHKGL